MTGFRNRKLRAALAASNLINCGFDGPQVLANTQKWVEMLSHATEHFRDYLNSISSIPLKTNFPERDTNGRDLYLSWHQFPYQLIYKVLYLYPRGEWINILSGKIPEPFATRYTDALRAMLGCNVRFIQSSSKVVRAVRSVLGTEPVVTYIDSPWSESSDPIFDCSYTVPFGEFQSRSTFERFIEHLSDYHEFVLVAGDPTASAELTWMGPLSFSTMYELMAKQILSFPARFQNLDKLHKSVLFRAPKKWVVSFVLNGSRYGIRTDTMRLYSVNGLNGRLPPEQAIAPSGDEICALFERNFRSEVHGVVLL